MVAMTIALYLAVRYWMEALFISVNIKPTIFANDYNIAVLNDEALFTISIKNDFIINTNFIINIYANGNIINTRTLNVKPQNTDILVLSQKLMHIGEWVLEVRDNSGNFLNSYSFIVVANRDEALIQIHQLGIIQETRNQMITGEWVQIGTLFIALLGLVGGVPAIKRYFGPKPDLRVESIKAYFTQSKAKDNLNGKIVGRSDYIGLHFVIKNHGSIMATGAKCIWTLNRKDNSLQVMDSYRTYPKFDENIGMVGSGSIVQRDATDILVYSMVQHEIQIKLSCAERDFNIFKRPIHIEGIPSD